MNAKPPGVPGAPKKAKVGSRHHPRALVAYASRAGSTRTAAGIVGEALESGGALVDVCALDAGPDPSSYDAVILGTAIRYDRPLPELRRFVAEHRAALEALPCALFFTCLTLAKDPDPHNPQAASYANTLSQLLPQIPSDDVGRFAGALQYGSLRLLPRLALRLLSRISGIHEGDYLDDEALRCWAKDVAARWTKFDVCEGCPPERLRNQRHMEPKTFRLEPPGADHQKTAL